MIRLLLPLLGAAAVGLASVGAATASTGGLRAGPPVSGNGSRATGVASTASTSAHGSPALTVSGASPVVVHGLRFAKSERVRVSFRAGDLSLARTVRATTAGSFVLTAPGSLAYDPCSTTLVIVARGTTGDIVTVRRPPRGCAPG
jgi:hypothetical protein